MILVGGEELKWRQLAHHLLKPMIKAKISGRMVFNGISDVTFASVYSEKTRLKKLMMMKMIITSNRNPFTSK